MQESYINDKPLYLEHPDLSVFHIMDKGAYSDMEAVNVQEILRTQHIVLTNATSTLPLIDAVFPISAMYPAPLSYKVIHLLLPRIMFPFSDLCTPQIRALK